MGFKVQARTLLHLGAELISSDAIALFELIKNAFDAGSPEVHIDVVVRLPDWPSNYSTFITAAKTGDAISIHQLREKLLTSLDMAASGAGDWASAVRATRKVDELCMLATQANTISVSDTGHGMSKADLDEVYLTIGTRHRLEERKAPRSQDTANAEKKRPILGEKGLGRLSVMRLGDAVKIETTRRGEARWNVLEIDWTAFAHEIDQSITDVEVSAKSGPPKKSNSENGTRIEISNLKSTWDEKKLQRYSQESVSKLTDPFSPKRLFKVILRINGNAVRIERLDTDMFKFAHGNIEAEFHVSGTEQHPALKLSGTMSYMNGQRVAPFSIEDLTHLSSTVALSPQIAFRLGSFSMRAYWFNRQVLRLRKPDGPEIVAWVKAWAGGLMLFRDGFRVHPYGEPEDDWLGLDRKALGSGGYKLNRQQIIGKVDIQSDFNPALTDQTNREGLRDCPEKEVLTNLLRHVISTEWRGFLNKIEAEQKATLDLDMDQLTAKAAEEREKLENNFKLLKARYPAIRDEKEIISSMDSAIDQLEGIMIAAEKLANEFEEGRTQLVHLAGLGLMVEMLAHELNRSTHYALIALGDLKEKRNDTAVPQPLKNLELQLKTLEKRLKTLDPATTSGRQRKETFDLIKLVEEVMEGHVAEFERHKITYSVKTKPAQNAQFKVKMVKGMVVQILENLLNNSVYWLKHQQLVHPNASSAIYVDINVANRELCVTDTGPGVLESFREKIFEPFFTTKPPGLGKGLGLFISRDLARYHDATLTLSDEQRIRPKHYNTFILTLPDQTEK